jgi:DNA helicase II / ATP-dependent DNA helicase PcrA
MLEMNPEQREAVEHGEGPLLIVAGPGAGKTRVITQRIVYLLESSFSSACAPLLPGEILGLTFTEKAAEEMKRRVAEALPDFTAFPTICTFHAFCYQMLRKRHLDRRLLDKIDVWIFLRRRMAELGLKYYQKLAEPGAFLHDLNEFFSRCQDELIEPADFEQYVQTCREKLLAHQPQVLAARAAAARSAASQSISVVEHPEWEEILKRQELAHVFTASRRLLDEAGASSLGSLISETVALWQNEPEVLEIVRAQYRAVLVDEFQDTNYGQVELLNLLVKPPYNITAVGDDDQAIYRFRGASHGAFEMFGKAFPGHRAIFLARNYRSTRKILRVAVNLIGHNDRFAEKPALISHKDEGCPVYLLKARDAESEAFWIADEIERLAREELRFGEMAILYRAHVYRDFLVEELRRREIPFAIRGLSLLSVSVLRDLVAYLKLIHSPHENISLTRVLLAPRWRFPDELAQTIRQTASRERRSLYSVMKDPAPELAPDLAATAWGDLEKLLKGLRRLSKSLPVTILMDRLIDRLGWRTLPGSPDQVYLETFRGFLNDWEAKSETRRLHEFVEYFAYFIEAGGKIEAPEPTPGQDAVQMMTIHAAKGLEFPVVFVISVSPRRFPATERKPVIEFPAELRKGPPSPPDIHLQEERRLFFVAITRAQERLYVSSVSKSAKQQSVFVSDLLSDPVISGRDIEAIDVPEAPSVERMSTGPRPGVARAHPAPPRNGNAVTPSQGSLFDEAGAGEGLEHPALDLWARESRGEAPGEKIQLSATAIEDYLDCPLKFKFQHILKIPTAPQAALTFGNLMHRSVRHYFELRRKSLPSFDELEAFYLDRWKSTGFDDDYQEETYRKAGLDQLRVFVDRQNAIAVECRNIQMEQPFRMDFGDMSLEGRIDQITLLEPAREGAVELIDYKTGRPRTEKDAQKSLQLSVYALAAKKILHLTPVRMTFYNLTNNEPVSTVRTPEDLEDALKKAREVAAQVRNGSFNPAPGFVCRWCEFNPVCPAHED